MPGKAGCYTINRGGWHIGDAHYNASPAKVLKLADRNSGNAPGLFETGVCSDSRGRQVEKGEAWLGKSKEDNNEGTMDRVEGAVSYPISLSEQALIS